MLLDHPRQIDFETLISKITKAKWTIDVAQAHMCKHKVLRSNPTPTNKRKICVYNCVLEDF
jgi:hypothetical protein